MRWQVELFFKWIQQHLRIKAFFGTSENAVKGQIWIAVCTYVLVAIVRRRLKLEASMHRILQILSLTLFEKTPLDQLLMLAVEGPKPPGDANQLILFEYVGTVVISLYHSISRSGCPRIVPGLSRSATIGIVLSRDKTTSQEAVVAAIHRESRRRRAFNDRLSIKG